MKICPTCKKKKRFNQFHKNGKSADGLEYECITCQSIRYKEYRRVNRDRLNAYRRKKKLQDKYGISWETYESMYNTQGGRCAICGGDNDGKVFCVDHSHTTGKVRALLCIGCNLALGWMRDDPKIAKSAYHYLRRSEPQSPHS